MPTIPESFSGHAVNDFSGKANLITGAAGGIGQTMSRYFAERGGGVAASTKASEYGT